MNPKAQLVLNIVAFNVLWVALVVTQSVWAQLAGLGYVAYHFAVVAKTGEPRRVASLMLFGVVLDGILGKTGWFAFSPVVPWLPAWLIVLWAVFATTFEHSLAWLLRRPFLAGGLAAFSGPSSYWAGERLGAVAFPNDMWLTLGLLSLIWASLFYALALGYKRQGWV